MTPDENTTVTPDIGAMPAEEPTTPPADVAMPDPIDVANNGGDLSGAAPADPLAPVDPLADTSSNTPSFDTPSGDMGESIPVNHDTPDDNMADTPSNDYAAPPADEPAVSNPFASAIDDKPVEPEAPVEMPTPVPEPKASGGHGGANVVLVIGVVITLLISIAALVVALDAAGMISIFSK
ncbi:hypothetical protein FWF48_02185 [Candidatus Saccharibacteria bacterium]|nr:hypothetical protein [Candidatus Saccharibacteria bacterium]